MNPATANPPLTAAAVAAAVNGLILAFTALSGEQDAAICAAVVVVCGFLASRFTTPYRPGDHLDVPGEGGVAS